MANRSRGEHEGSLTGCAFAATRMRKLGLLVTCALLLLAAARVAAGSLTDGLIAYYPFNGNFEDGSGNGNSGTPTGHVDFVTGATSTLGQALKLYGVSDPGYVKVPNAPSLALTDRFSVSFFVRIDGATGMENGAWPPLDPHCVLGKDGDSMGLWANVDVLGQYGGALELAWGVRGSEPYYPAFFSTTGQVAYSLGSWLHVACVFDGWDLVQYVNGVVISTGPCVDPQLAWVNQRDLYIGAQANGGSIWYPLNGAIDELRIYSRALTADEVAALAGYTPTTDWVEVTATTAVMYRDPAAGDGAKVKQVPQGWALRNLGEVYVNPIPGSVMWKVKDETDETVGWVTNYLLGPASNGERAQLIVRGVDGDPTISATFMRDLNHDLVPDETSDDVRCLQYLLMAENLFSAEGDRIYPQSVGATGYFDVKTTAALKAFQTAYELDPSGVLDAPTRTVFDNLIAGGRYDLTGTRAEVVVQEVKDILEAHPPSWLTNSDFLRGATTEQKISIILALIAHESGPERHRFDNELITEDWGRGLMQVTTDAFVGKGSDLRYWGANGACLTCRKDPLRCKSYYTNTRQGIRANILDGLRALNDEKWEKAKKQCVGDDDEVMDSTRGIRRSELRWMLTLYLYNGTASLYAAQTVYEVWHGRPLEEIDGNWDLDAMYSIAWPNGPEGPQPTFADCLTACEDAGLIGVQQRNIPFYLKNVGERMESLGSPTNYGTPGEDYSDEELGDRFVYVNKNAVIADLTGLGAEIRAADAKPSRGDPETGAARAINEMYLLEGGGAVVFFQSAPTEFDVAGIGDGDYSVRVLQLSGDTTTWFTARQMSTSPGALDSYEVDWDVLARGEEGVTVRRDEDGDGVAEETIHSGSLLIGDGCTAVLSWQGWHMVSLPGALCDPCTWTDGVVCGDLVCALDDDIDPFYAFRYDTDLHSYARIPPASEICYQSGMGMWIYTWQTDTQIDSEVTALTGNVELALQNGWNQVGNPYTFSIGTGSIKVRCGAEELSLIDAQAQGWLTAMLFGYESGGYVVLDPVSGCLPAWTGCWLRAYRDCTLIFQPVGCTSSLTQARPLSMAEARALELPPPPPLDPKALDIKEIVAGLSATNIPNPIRSEHTTVFGVEGMRVDMVEELRVDIYDLSGQRVFTEAIASQELAWHTVNDAGELLANGVYLYRVWVKVGEIWYPLEIQKLAVVR